MGKYKFGWEKRKVWVRERGVWEWERQVWVEEKRDGDETIGEHATVQE